MRYLSATILAVGLFVQSALAQESSEADAASRYRPDEAVDEAQRASQYSPSPDSKAETWNVVSERGPRHCKTESRRATQLILQLKDSWSSERADEFPKFRVLPGETLCFRLGRFNEVTGYYELSLVDETDLADLIFAVEVSPEQGLTRIRVSNLAPSENPSHVRLPVTFEANFDDAEGRKHQLLGPRQESLGVWFWDASRVVPGSVARLNISRIKNPMAVTKTPAEFPRPRQSWDANGPRVGIFLPTYGYAIQKKATLLRGLEAEGYAPLRTYTRHLGLMGFASKSTLRFSIGISLAQAAAKSLRDDERKVHLVDLRSFADVGWEVVRFGSGVVYPFLGLGVGELNLRSEDELPRLFGKKGPDYRNQSIGTTYAHADLGLGYEYLVFEDRREPVSGVLLGLRFSYQQQLGRTAWFKSYEGGDTERLSRGDPLDLSGWMMTWLIGAGIQ